MKWKRYRLKTHSVNDCRPVIFDPKFPWWKSGLGEDQGRMFAIIIAYIPFHEDIYAYWPDAFDVEFTEHDHITFTSRYPQPEYFVE